MVLVWLAGLLGRWREHVAGRQRVDVMPPELLELDREAGIAMASCTCGHIWHQHLHAHVRTHCAACGCPRFRPVRTPGRSTGPRGVLD